MAVFADIGPTYAQIKRLFYIWFFQMDCAAEIVAAEDFAFIGKLCADWSPGYDAGFDLGKAKDCLRDPVHLAAALGYHHARMDPRRYGTPRFSPLQAEVWGGPVHPLRWETEF